MLVFKVEPINIKYIQSSLNKNLKIKITSIYVPYSRNRHGLSIVAYKGFSLAKPKSFSERKILIS